MTFDIRYAIDNQIGPKKQTLCIHQQEKGNLECKICGNQIDFQLLLLSIPPKMSLLLCEEYIRSGGTNASFLCRIMINIPDNPPFALLVTYSEFQMLFRLFGMCVGSFCIFTNPEISAICENLHDPTNTLLLEKFTQIFGKLVMEKTTLLKNLSLEESDEEKRHYMSKLLEMTCSFFATLQSETFNSAQNNPISYIRQTLIPTLNIIRGIEFVKTTITDDHGNSYDWFQHFIELFVKIRSSLGQELFKLDLVMSLLPITCLFTSHTVPENLLPTNPPRNIDEIVYVETLLKPEATIVIALSIPCYWLVKMAFGHYDTVFQSSALFKLVRQIVEKYIDPSVRRKNKLHTREYHFLARELANLTGAPDIEMVNKTLKLGQIIEQELKQVVISSSNSALEYVQTVYPYILFHYGHARDPLTSMDSYYMFLSTFWIFQKYGGNKFKNKANDLARKLKAVFNYIRQNTGCTYEPQNGQIYIQKEKTLLNVIHMNPLYGSNLIGTISQNQIFIELFIAIMHILNTFCKTETEFENLNLEKLIKP
jgi:hypothetical protein